MKQCTFHFKDKQNQLVIVTRCIEETPEGFVLMETIRDDAQDVSYSRILPDCVSGIESCYKTREEAEEALGNCTEPVGVWRDAITLQIALPYRYQSASVEVFPVNHWQGNPKENTALFFDAVKTKYRLGKKFPIELHSFVMETKATEYGENKIPLGFLPISWRCVE